MNSLAPSVSHVVGKGSPNSRADFIGHTHGLLTVTRLATTIPEALIGRGRAWECRCKCGGTKIVSSEALVGPGGIKSCGCVKGGKTSEQFGARYAFLKYKRGAIKRGKTWDLSEEQFVTLTSLNCHYCGSRPGRRRARKSTGRNNERPREYLDYTANGIDRVDSTLGYTWDNSVSCCSMCNFAKRDYVLDDFFDMGA